MKRTVVYLSTCGTDASGKPGSFFLQELPWLLAHFDRVVLCDNFGVAQVTQPRPERIALARPAFGTLRAWLRAPFLPEFWREVRHLRRDGQLRPVPVGKLLLFTVRGLKLSHWAQTAIRAEEQTTLYSFWMSYDGFAAALCKRRNPNLYAIARGHAFDIDAGRNPMNPYLMKRFMLDTLNGVYPISMDAKARLADCAALPTGKVQVLGMGSAGGKAEKPFPAPIFTDGVLRVVSCATLTPIKRVPLLIDALALWRGGPVRWTHMGGGPDENAVRAYAAEKLGQQQHIEFEFTGSVPPEHVAHRYAVQPFDVFVNTSRMEGVPVSVMEAMRAGVPVVAPAVGGIPELVDAQTGRLFAPDGGAAAVLEALEAIASLSAGEAQAMRAAAQARWNERCNSELLLQTLFAQPRKEGDQP